MIRLSLLSAYALWLLFAVIDAQPALGNRYQSVNQIPLPQHKPLAPLSDYWIEECRSRIIQNTFFEAHGSFQRVPVAALCDQLEDKDV